MSGLHPIAAVMLQCHDRPQSATNHCAMCTGVDMSGKLELVREEKLFRLLPARRKSSRLEASGVALVDDKTALGVFDNLNQVARIDLSLSGAAARSRRSAEAIPRPEPGGRCALQLNWSSE
jgi:hypothetical protein